jgi:hypothetical protein
MLRPTTARHAKNTAVCPHLHAGDPEPARGFSCSLSLLSHAIGRGGAVSTKTRKREGRRSSLYLATTWSSRPGYSARNDGEVGTTATADSAAVIRRSVGYVVTDDAVPRTGGRTATHAWARFAVTGSSTRVWWANGPAGKHSHQAAGANRKWSGPH